MKIHNPPMTFAKDMKKEFDDGLANNQDPYGNAVYRYASEWATRMEQKFLRDVGVRIESASDDVVSEWLKMNMEKTSHEADTEGITGFMYGCAASILSSYWVAGEQARKRHNLDTQIDDEGERANESGGILNPALMSIG